MDHETLDRRSLYMHAHVAAYLRAHPEGLAEAATTLARWRAKADERCRDFVIIGSQAILGEHPDAPAELRVSREVDIYPLEVPALADLIDGTLGEGSPFDTTGGRRIAISIGP